MAYFLKVEITERFNATWTEFHEIEFYHNNKKIGIQNLKVVDTNLTNTSYPASFAIDGVLNTGTGVKYVAMNSDLPHYIIIESSVNFDKVIFYDNNGKTDGTQKYASKKLFFSISKDNVDWNPIKEVTNTLNENVSYIVENIYFEKTAMILKNPTTNQAYSLDDKTLISMPDTSNKNMILYGIETGKEIKLDEDFDKVNYPVEGVLRETVETMVKPLSIKFE